MFQSRKQKLVPAKKPEPENVLASIIAAKCGFLCRCTHTCYLTVKIHNVIMYTRRSGGDAEKEENLRLHDALIHIHASSKSYYTISCNK